MNLSEAIGKVVTIEFTNGLEITGELSKVAGYCYKVSGDNPLIFPEYAVEGVRSNNDGQIGWVL